MITPKPPKEWGKTWVGLIVRPKRDLKNRGGQVIRQGRPAYVTRAFNGLHLRAVTKGKNVHFTRVSPSDVNIFGKINPNLLK